MAINAAALDEIVQNLEEEYEALKMRVADDPRTYDTLSEAVDKLEQVIDLVNHARWGRGFT